MKILTRNIGLYRHMKFAPRRGGKIQGQSILHQFFNKGNLTTIKELIKEQNPDLSIFQELTEKTESELLTRREKIQAMKVFQQECMKQITGIINYKDKSKKKLIEIKNKTINIIETAKHTIIPVHLHAFSPQKRLEQTKELISIAKKCTKPFVILGDFNFRSRNNYFLYKNDRKAYKLLTEFTNDLSKNIKTSTPRGAKLDFIFSNIPQEKAQVTCVRKKGRFMDHYPLLITIDEEERQN